MQKHMALYYVLYVTLVPVACTTLWMLKNETVTQKLNVFHVSSNKLHISYMFQLFIQCMHHLARNADSLRPCVF